MVHLSDFIFSGKNKIFYEERKKLKKLVKSMIGFSDFNNSEKSQQLYNWIGRIKFEPFFCEI